MALADTLTTREAVRRAALEDIIARCELAAQTFEGGELDGIKFVSMGTLRDQVVAARLVDLPTPSEKFAEVRTPATITVSALCPECGLPTEIVVKLAPQLTVTNDGAELSVKAKAKARVHVHNQLSLPEEAGDQLGMDDVVIDDLRVRILTAVADVCEERVAEPPAEPGPPPTLDAIAQRLEFSTEHERGDLEETLYRYSQLDEPLISILSAPGAPVEYTVTPAGLGLIETDAIQAEYDAGGADEEGPITDANGDELEHGEPDPQDGTP